MGSDQTDPKAPKTPDSGHVNPEDDKITLEVSKKLDEITLEVSKKPAETTPQCSLDVIMEESTTGTNDAIDEENDGFKTPENQGIPVMTECPPAPKKRFRYDDELHRPRVTRRRRRVHIYDAAFQEFFHTARVDISWARNR